MPTPTDFFGNEYGALLSVQGGGLYFAIAGAPIVQSTIKHSGTYALRAELNGVNSVQYKVQASTTTFVGCAWFYFNSLPNGTVRFMEIDNETVLNCWFEYLGASTNDIRASFEGNLPQTTGVTVTTGVWHRIDWKVVLSADPTTLDWAYDGIQQTQVTRAGTGTNIGGIKVGNMVNIGSAGQYCYVDDVIYSVTAADFMAMNNISVLGLVPTGEGTHNNAANVLEDGAGADINGTTVQAYPLIDDMPWSTTLNDRIQHNLLGAANYVEVVFTDISETTILAVKGYLEYAAAAAQGNTGATYIRLADTTEYSIYGTGAAPADMSETTAFFKSALLGPPGGGWTTAIVNGITLRIGRSGDATPDPWWEAVMLEYAYSSGATGTLALTLDAFGLTASGVSTIVGAVTKTLDDFGLNAVGVSTIVGSAAITLDNLGLTATGVITVVGSLTKTLDDLGLTATGTVTEAGIVGTLTLTLDNFGLSASGVSTIVGGLTKTLDDLGLSAVGISTIVGAVSKTLDDFGLSGSGAITVIGSLTKTLDDLGLSAAGVSTIVGALAKTLDDLGLTATGTVTETGGIVGTLTLTLDAFGLTASGVSTIVGSSNITLGDFGLSASGQATIVGSAAIAIDPLGLTGAGAVTIAGAANISLDGFGLSAVGNISIAGAAAFSLDPFALTAVGVVSSGEDIIGTANITLDNFGLLAVMIVYSGIYPITLQSRGLGITLDDEHNPAITIKTRSQSLTVE